MNLKELKFVHHLKGKLKDGKIGATAGYVGNSLATSVSLLNFTDLQSFYICILVSFFYVNISLPMYRIILSIFFL